MELNKAKRFKRPFTIIFLDLDNFKEVNDNFGHDQGDAALCSVARTTAENIRSVDIFARLGGDEFAVFLPETGPDAADTIVKKLHASLLEAMQSNGWPITFSIGVATFDGEIGSVDQMIKKADDIMYSVKSSGKNNIKRQVFK